jgi:hypothetical protein
MVEEEQESSSRKKLFKNERRIANYKMLAITHHRHIWER